jgi:preprotein translocase subunit SecG
MHILLFIQIIIAILLIVLVLLQKSDGDSLSGIGGGSGGLNSAISRKSGISFLNKVTFILVGVFLINCLILAKMSKSQHNKISQDLEKAIEQQQNSPANTNQIPTVE